MDEDDFKALRGRVDDHSKEIATLRTFVTTVKWMLSIGLPVAIVVIGAYMSLVNNGITDIRDKIGAVESKLSDNAVQMARVEVTMGSLRRDINDMRRREDR